jgi:hypothetical protein
MKRLFRILVVSFFVLVSLIMMLRAQSCTPVKSYQHENLADPIMSPENQFSKQNWDEKFFSTREGSIGGAKGIGGGCGCAK